MGFGHAFKFLKNRKRGKIERWRRSSALCERVQALAGENKTINF
jgi:hypothetical protein